MSPEDRTEIERLVFSYARYVDTTEYDALGALFENGEIKSNKQSGDTRAALRGAAAVSHFYATTNKGYGPEGARTHHVVTNLEFQPQTSPDEVRLFSCFTVFQRTPTLALQPIVCGRYRDVFRKTDGRWHFAEKFIDVTLIGDLSQHLNITL